MIKKIVVLLFFSTTAWAWNPITDIRDNLIWTLGQSAEFGTAVKVAGSDTQLKDGDTSTSALASIANYRFLAFSYGGTRINQSNANPTDTFKVGLRLTSFFDLFKNPPTPQMNFLRNINIGPSFAMPLASTPRVGTVLIDLNYAFSGK